MVKILKFVLPVFIGLVILSCEKENFTTDSSVFLGFSVDTLLFDTVFTTIGTTTMQFMVYNHNKKDVLISSIYLAKGESSFFRMNVDGKSARELEDITIYSGDSMYIFVEATIDPLNANNPMVVKDSIVFLTNGNFQDIDLVAYGQDVHLINAEILSSQTWINDKPYLVYNSMLVDTSETLDIQPGVRVYFHKGSTLYVCGTLIISGTLEEPVVFLGDRLDDMYKDIPGQWGGIYFINGSKDNEIIFTEILNATTGIHLGNFYANDPPPDLKLSNSILQHMTFAGISSIGATVIADNCLIADCGYYTTILTTGGSYQFAHCTFANYWNWTRRTTPSLVLTNYYNLNDTAIFTGNLVNADFGNCIIEGNMDNEIGLNNLTGAGDFNYFFDHCLLKSDTSLNTSDPEFFRNVWTNKDPGFISSYEFDFQLDTLAFAKDKGLIDIANNFPFDILGNSRLEDAGPDLGAYERIE